MWKLKSRWKHVLLSTIIICILIGINHYISHREPPLIKIDSIKAYMNFSTACIEGTLETNARPLRDGIVFFTINDGSGTVSVFATPEPHRRMPREGAKVRVTGILNVGSNNDVRLRAKMGTPIYVLEEPQQASFKSDYDIAQLVNERPGTRLTVYGRVAKYWSPDEGSRAPHKIVLEDHSGRIDVVHWLDDVKPLRVGDEIEVYGRLDLYREELQIRLWNADDLKPYTTEHTLTQSN